ADTLVEWARFYGVDAREASSPAFGAFVVDPGAALRLHSLEIHAGIAGAGVTGAPGEKGSFPGAAAEPGDSPRPAEEGARHLCVPGSANVVRGGEGGENTCDGLVVDGGDGGSATCPSFASVQSSGQPGADTPARRGGRGGRGGQDCRGPIMGP